jgi:hypothetical protein
MHSVSSQINTQSPPNPLDPWGSYTYTSTREVFRPASFTMTDGGTTPLNGSFNAVPQKTFTFDYKGSRFNQLLSDAPSANLSNAFVFLSVFVEHGAPEVAIGGTAPLLDLTQFAIQTWEDPLCNPDTCDLMACTNGCVSAPKLILPGDHSHDFSYGNPFTSGQLLASLSFNFRNDVTQLLPNDTTPERLSGRVSLQGPIAEMSGAPLQPATGLPRNVKVNGQTAPVDQLTTGVGTTPTITFDPPATGSPTDYLVQVTDLDDVKDANGVVLRRNRLIASLFLTNTTTSVQIPPGVLQAGKHYYVQVSALVQPSNPAAPEHLLAKGARSTTYTGIVVP